MKIDISYDFLFSKKSGGEYNHILSIDKNDLTNPLYNKEIFVLNIDGNRDVMFQALGYTGCYANNFYDSTIHYILLPNSTIDKLLFEDKDEVIKWIETTCEEQRAKSKDPKRWRFNMKFVLESEVVNFIKERALRVGEDCILDLIYKY